ncbi:MAG: hypothetical protein V1744_05990 [Candidatus Altiarchaeota archaeon]
MLETLKAMMKEEWRIHSLMFGNRSFSFFPFMLVILAFIGSMMLPLYAHILSREEMAAIIHFTYLFFGLSVGSFGLMGQEALNRRLGDLSLVAYISRILPVSERRLFANFIAKDTIFYIMFLVAPFVAGYVPARMILGLSLSNIPLIAVTLTLTFLLGLTVSFALSTAYAHFGKPLLVVVGLAVFWYSVWNPTWLTFEGVMSMTPTLQYYLHPTASNLVLSMALVFLPSALSVAYLKVDYRLSVKRFHNEYGRLVDRLGLGIYSPFLAKDLLDLNRSEGGLAKVAVSYVFPLAAVALVVSFFANLLPIQGYHSILIMALMTGLVSTSLYNWLAEYDFPELYEFLPITTPYIIKSKLVIYAFFTAVMSTVVLILAYLYLLPPPVFLPLSFLLTASVAAYTTAVTVYLAGLRPNVMLYSGKLFFYYLIALMPLLLIPAVAFMTGYPSMTTSIGLVLVLGAFMLPAADRLLRKSYVKWKHPISYITG